MCWCGTRTEVEPPTPQPTPPPRKPGGPGTELKKLIPKFFQRKNCGCKAYATKMDRWGISGCIEHKEEIINYLVSQARSRIVLKYFPSICQSVATEWVEQAINNTVAALPKLSAVWVYWAGGAEADELTYSIRSAVTNLFDLKEVAICGDIPEWYQGYSIPSPKFTRRQAQAKYGTGRWAKWVDSVIKLQRIIDDPHITDDFLWMYDDTFIVRPTTIDELSVPRYTGLLTPDPATPAKGTWREAMRRTAKHLSDHGFPIRNYSSHYPAVYNKDLLQQTLDTFRPDKYPRVVESLYFNHHNFPALPLDSTFQYTRNIKPGWTINKSARVVNVGGFHLPIRSVMYQLYNTPSPYELPNESMQLSL